MLENKNVANVIFICGSSLKTVVDLVSEVGGVVYKCSVIDSQNYEAVSLPAGQITLFRQLKQSDGIDIQLN